jgi:prepilin-type processing-associated H-X9-DG protein
MHHRQCSPGRLGMSLVEALVLIAIIVVLVLVCLPAIAWSRERARKSACANNLKQLALAAQQYVGTYGVYPVGIRYQFDPASGAFWTAGSCLLMLMQQSEYRHAYDACNFNIAVYDPINSTISDIGIPMLWCPSDLEVSKRDVIPRGMHGGGDLPMRFTSYGANAGEVFLYRSDEKSQAQLRGIVYIHSAVGTAQITDGTSTTLLLGEWAHGQLPDGRRGRPNFRREFHWWTSGNYGDTMFCTFFPPSAFDPSAYKFRSTVHSQRVMGGKCPEAGTVSSFHSGGANVAFCDGSIHFIKNGIDSWKNDPKTDFPPGVRRDPADRGPERYRPYVYEPGMYVGVYQKLSTRNGGEAISPGSY